MNAITGIRTFHDLREFAAANPSPAGSEPQAWTANRIDLPLPEGAVTVGVLRLAGSGTQVPQTADEFVHVLTGSLELTGEGKVVQVPEGASCVLPAGRAFDWSAQTGTTVVTMTCAGPASEAAGITPVDLSAPLAPSGAPLAELLVGPTPSCRNFTDFRSANGEFVCGTWDSSPYHRLPMRYGHHELMHLLEGAVTFVDEAGREKTFRKGDVFLVEQGASCSWESTVHVKKVYAIYRPAA
ncbi:DUF861 domain-containing protein [Novosphingobium sp. 1Y9A]|uniref:DUF861 domain-containing protein n=1 Tax=Novosphingobium jiangmenense TaxID=2791981 RepID=A0ABS0HDY0_9SPHN|nr:DUF861 domain-containing protein [Novosphingobium jiangmenense]